LLLATDNNRRTVFHEAAQSFNEEIFKGILNWAKKNLTIEEVNNLLLVTDNGGRTVFYEAAKSFNERVFQGILN
jgi:hypothetical protein